MKWHTHCVSACLHCTHASAQHDKHLLKTCMAQPCQRGIGFSPGWVFEPRKENGVLFVLHTWPIKGSKHVVHFRVLGKLLLETCPAPVLVFSAKGSLIHFTLLISNDFITQKIDLLMGCVFLGAYCRCWPFEKACCKFEFAVVRRCRLLEGALSRGLGKVYQSTA